MIWLKVSVSKPSYMSSAGQDIGAFNNQLGGIESSSDDHSSPPAGSQVSSCAVSRRTSIGPHFRSVSDDVGFIGTSESHENSIVRAKQQCGAEILNFEHLKMRLDKLTGQNREKQRQSDVENGNSTISPSPSCACISSHVAAANLPYVGSWPLGLDRTPSIESDVLFPADSGVSSMRSVMSFAADSSVSFLSKCTGAEQKLLPSDAVWAASSLASVQGDSLASRVASQQVRHEPSVSSHLQCQHHPSQAAACHDLLTQPSVVSTCPPVACPALMNASNSLSAFQQPGYMCDHVQPSPACTTEWQRQVLLQQIQQQSLMLAQQMQVQHPLMMQCQQMLRLQQHLHQQQQAMQLMQSTLFPSQPKPDLMQNAFVGAVPLATGLPLQYPQWQIPLTNLLIESGLLPGKAHELVQQLQHIMMSSCPVQIPGTSMFQSLTNSGLNVDAYSQLYQHLMLSHLCGNSLPWSFLASWSNIQAAYSQVVQLLAQPNPLITPELLESMFAQLPPPLNLNASDCLNSTVMFEVLYTRLVELLTMQIGQLPVSPVQLTPPVSMQGFFGTSTSIDNNSCINRSATVQSMQPSGEDKPCAVTLDSKKVGTPMKVTRTSSVGLEGSNTHACPLHRGASLDSESGDVPGAKVSGIARSGMTCSRHNVPTGNGAKMSGTSVPKKNVDCPQGLADLDMALKEKLRPRTNKGISQTIPEHSKTTTAVTVLGNVVSCVSSASQLAAAPATCELQRSCVTHVNASNCSAIITPRNTAVTLDASAVPKLHGMSVTKSAPVIVSEKTSAVKKQQVPVAQESVCKAGEVASDALFCLKVASVVPGNASLPEVKKDIVVKPTSSSMCVSIAGSSVQLAAKPSCASDHCLPPSVSLLLSSLPTSDVNRQHVSDSAIAVATTQLAQKHLQKKIAATDQETVSAIDVTARQPRPMMPVSYSLFSGLFLTVFVICFEEYNIVCFLCLSVIQFNPSLNCSCLHLSLL